MTSEYLTRKELIRRRKLDTQELLNAYQIEYFKLLKELGQRYRKLKTPFVNDLSEVQKLLVLAKYNELLNGSFQTQQRSSVEIAELKEGGISVLSDVKVTCGESGILTFPQAEGFLISQTENTLRSSSRLTPHLSTSSSPQLTDLDHSGTEASEQKTIVAPQSALIERMQVLHRLEEVACAAGCREMDRKDCLVTLLTEKGRYLIRQTSFTVGRCPLNSTSNSTVDVNLTLEDSVNSGNQVLAHVWMKIEGKVFLRSAGLGEITVDGVVVKQGEVVALHHWSLLEIDRIQLMTLMNHSAALRVRKRSREAMNI